MDVPANPYFLFAGNEYYPEGGMGDYRGTFATEDAARAAFATLRAKPGECPEWGQIATVEDGKLTPLWLWGAWVKGKQHKAWTLPDEGAE